MPPWRLRRRPAFGTRTATATARARAPSNEVTSGALQLHVCLRLVGGAGCPPAAPAASVRPAHGRMGRPDVVKWRGCGRTMRPDRLRARGRGRRVESDWGCRFTTRCGSPANPRRLRHRRRRRTGKVMYMMRGTKQGRRAWGRVHTEGKPKSQSARRPVGPSSWAVSRHRAASPTVV